MLGAKGREDASGTVLSVALGQTKKKKHVRRGVKEETDSTERNMERKTTVKGEGKIEVS